MTSLSVSGEQKKQEKFDREMMARALRLAERGLYTTSPNPRVGCVICKDGQIIAEGWHQRAGEAHAEINALNRLGERQAEGSTVYVTLEPCCHTGRTGPCSEELIKAGVKRVVCAMRDPAPHVSGGGVEALEKAGIEVDIGLLENDARLLNCGFVKRMEQGLPWVRLKMAMSLDGRTALQNGDSKWITGESSRKDVHHWRARSDAILTGSGTVLADDPQMTARLAEEVEVKQAQRFVIDSQARLTKSEKIFEGGEPAKIFGIESSDDSADFKVKAGVGDKVDLPELLECLSQQEINELWIEAGPTLAGAIVEADLFDELIVYLAPVVLGDKARPLFEMKQLNDMQDKKQLQLMESRRFDEDMRLTFRKK